MKTLQTRKLAAAIWLLMSLTAAGGGNVTPIAIAQAAAPQEAAKNAVTKPAESTKSELPPLKKLTVRVVDLDKKPVVGAHVGLAAHFATPDEPKKPADTDGDGFVYDGHRLTNSSGVAELELGGADLRAMLDATGIVVRDEKRHLAAVLHPDLAKVKDSLDVTLAPECRVSGKVMSPELKKDEKPLGPTTVSLGDGDHVMLTFTSEGTGDYHFFVPPGQYLLDAAGSKILTAFNVIEVPWKEHEMLFEPILAQPNKLALLSGQPAPELRGAAAWKNGPPVTLASLKGKCVLLFFWRATSAESLAAVPAILDLYDKLKKAGLEVVGVEVDVDQNKKPIDSVQKLDDALAKVRKDAWGGRDLPFPVAIVAPRLTVFSNFKTALFADSQVTADYGVTQYPTVLLIDRHGVLVNELDDSEQSLALLQKTLGLKVSATPPSPAKPATPPPIKAPPSSATKAAPAKP